MTSSAYKSTSNSIIERMFGYLRNILRHNQTSYHRKNQIEVLHASIEQLNSYPRASLAKYTDGRTPPSAKAIHYGLPEGAGTLENILGIPDAGNPDGYWQKYASILKDFDTDIDKTLENKQELEKISADLEVGQLVFVRNMTRHKIQSYYYSQLFEILEVGKSRIKVQSLFYQGKATWVSKDFIKPYTSDDLMKELPPDFKLILGENLDANEIKRLTSDGHLPNYFKAKPELSEPMTLRYRLSPASVASVPAIRVDDSRPPSTTGDLDDDSTITAVTLPQVVAFQRRGQDQKQQPEPVVVTQPQPIHDPPANGAQALKPQEPQTPGAGLTFADADGTYWWESPQQPQIRFLRNNEWTTLTRDLMEDPEVKRIVENLTPYKGPRRVSFQDPQTPEAVRERERVEKIKDAGLPGSVLAEQVKKEYLDWTPKSINKRIDLRASL